MRTICDGAPRRSAMGDEEWLSGPDLSASGRCAPAAVGNRPEGDAMMQGRFTLPRAALELTDLFSKARSTGDGAKMGA